MEHNYCYMSFLTRDPYLLYTISLWHSWKEMGCRYPFKVMITDTLGQSSIDIMDKLGIEYFMVDTKEFDKIFAVSKIKPAWKECFKKLALFKQYDYDRILYLDSDTYMTKNMDCLFDSYQEGTLTCTGRWGQWKEKVTKLLGGMFVLHPNEEDYNRILKLLDEILNNEHADVKQLTPETTNDEHILSEVFKGRLNPIDQEWQYNPHPFNQRDIEWDKIALVHIATPKDKWFKEGRFINNDVKMPYSKYDYAMCYWYFNKMDDVVRLYGLDKMRDDMKILTPTDPIDMTKIELRKPKPKKDSSNDMETLW